MTTEPHTSFRPAAPSRSAARPPYERHAGLHVLRLAGDDYEMGYQHGTLLKEAIARGPLPYFERYVESMIAAGLGPALGALIAAGLRGTVGRKIAAGIPQDVRRGLDGLADGAGIRRRALFGAVTMPETYLWVLHALLRLNNPRLAPRTGVPLMGCTSAVAWGSATKDGAMLHGRNFDYQGVGAWDTEQAVVFHRPKGGQPYVSVSAAGVLLGGVTAMNASGLSLVVHQHMASDALTLGGLPIGIAGDRVMRHAKNLEDARRILDDHVPNGCWTYVITSARDARALCYEVTPKGRACFFADDGTFAYSNVFLDPALGESERHLYPSHWRNNLARLGRARGLLADAKGSIDAPFIAKILGDPGENGCRFERSISMIMTVASVVFRPGDGVVYVATGRAPVSNREYVAFDLGREAPRQDMEPLGGDRLDEQRTRAFDAYRAAYEAYFNEKDLGRARGELERAVEIQPNEALYHFVLALIALRERDTTRAERALDRALTIGHRSGERVATFHLWRGRARDAAGRRDAAVSDYHLARGGDEYVRAAAEKGLGRAWKPRRFGIEFTLADVPMP
jgi:Acyl-coenzyme A:6-aminopenicillanic acid acyl-transferase